MNPYEVLEVSPSATPEEIKEAYHRLAKKWHPDRFMGPEHEEAEKRFRMLAEAFSMLKNSTARPVPPPPPEPTPAAKEEGAPIALNTVPPASRTAQDWFGEAKAAFENRDMARALSLVHYALKMDAENVDSLLLLAKLLDHPGGDVRKLIQTLESILRLNPKEVNSAIRLAELYQSVGLSTKATRMWENVHRMAPGHPIFNQKTKSSPTANLGEQFNELVGKLKGLFSGKK